MEEGCRSLVNAMGLQLECAGVLHESLLVRVLTYGSEAVMGGRRIRVVQMENLRGVLGIRRIDKIPNARIKERRVTKGANVRINEGVLRWFDHVERVKHDRRAKRVFVGDEPFVFVGDDTVVGCHSYMKPL